MRQPRAGRDERLEALLGACRRAGLRLTHQRLEILREVAGREDHPDAEAIFRSVRARAPTLSLDTVYRTLWRLADAGLITTLGQRRDSVRFDPNVAPHHHYVCTRCGLVRDFESGDLSGLPVPRSVRRFGSVTTTHVEARGVCEACTASGGAGAARTDRKKSKDGRIRT